MSERGVSSTGVVVVQGIPRVCRHDVFTTIKVSGLPPDSPITVRMDAHNDDGQKFSSVAQYVSDGSGKVDLNLNESVGGSYTGVFPMGLFSTLQEYPFTGTRLWKQDPTTPWKMDVSVCSGHVSLDQWGDGEGVLGSIQLVRFLMGPGVRRVMVREGRIRGALYLPPPGHGPFPAILDLFGGDGGLKEFRAAMVASRGFACLALAYFKYDDLPKTQKQLDLEYFEEGVEFLLSQPEVIPDRCGVLGSSKGCDYALAMAIHIDKVKAVFCSAGILAAAKSDLTYKGRLLWSGAEMDSRMKYDAKGRVVFDENKMLELFRHDSPYIVPCETAPDDTFFILVAGDQDTTHAQLAVEGMAERMKRHGRESQCRTIIYPGVGHIIEPPYNTTSDHSKYFLPIDDKNPGLGTKKVVNHWGGEPRGTCYAQEDFWRQLYMFFNLHIRDHSAWYQQYLQR